MKRLLGISVSWMVPSIYEAAYWDATTQEFIAWDEMRTAAFDDGRRGILPVCAVSRGGDRAPGVHDTVMV